MNHYISKTFSTRHFPAGWLSVLLILALTGCFRTSSPSPLRTQAGETFDVYRDGTSSTYHAESPTKSYSGSLKSVVENATYYLVANGGGTLSFRAGDFDLGSSWFEFYDVTGVSFLGQGMDVTTIRNDSSASTDTEIFDCTRCDSISIMDMTVSAGGPDRSTSDAMDFDGGDGNTIERVKVTDSRGRGIVFDGKGDPRENLGSADNNVIRDCVISGSTIPSDGIQLLASNQNLIEGCTITDVGGEGIYANKSSTGADQPNKPSNDNMIRNNHIENVGRDGIKVNSGSRNEISGNTVLNSADDVSSLDGIRIISYNSVPCDDNIISLNTATDNQTTKTQKYGLKILSAACNRTVVSDNDFAGNLVGEIYDNGTNTVYSSDDSQAPTTPGNLGATAVGPFQIDLNWSAASDNVAVTGYELWRNGSTLATLGNETSYSDTSVQPGNNYDYQVRARDAAGNWSAFSNIASAATSGATVLTFLSTDDAYISQDQPNNNYGTSTTLRADGSPVQDTLIKFLVTGVGNGQVSSATLRLYNTNSASLGGNFFATNSTWDQESVTWNNAPLSGGSLGALGSVQPGNWYEVDVSSAVQQDGWVSFRVSSTSANGAYYSSKEGPNAPQLVLVATGNTSENIAPVADPQSVSTDQGVPLTVTLTGFDSNGDCPLDFSISSQPAHGTLSAVNSETCNGGSVSAEVTYTPNPDFSGADSFNFLLSDGSENSSPATVDITVNPGPGNQLSFAPSHDSYVRENRTTTNYGNSTSLRADGSPVQDILLTFEISGVGSAQVTSAVLRLYNVNSAGLGGNFYETTSNWDENTVVWNSAPATGAFLTSLGSVQPGNWYEVDITSAVSGDGLVSFKVSSTSANGAYYSSKEEAGFAPELIVTTQ